MPFRKQTCDANVSLYKGGGCNGFSCIIGRVISIFFIGVPADEQMIYFGVFLTMNILK